MNIVILVLPLLCRIHRDAVGLLTTYKDLTADQILRHQGLSATQILLAVFSSNRWP